MLATVINVVMFEDCRNMVRGFIRTFLLLRNQNAKQQIQGQVEIE